MSTMPSSTFANAAPGGARILCHQELFNARYFPQIDAKHYALAEKLPSATTKRMGPLAKELGVVLIVPVYGESFVSDPFGEFLAQGGAGEEIVAAEIDWRRVPELHELFQFLRDRGVDTYGAAFEARD